MTKMKAVLFFFAATTLTACSAHIDGGSANAPIDPPSIFAKPAIQGPNIEGTWETGCVLEGGQAPSKTKATFEAKVYTIVDSEYSDNACTNLVSQDTSTGYYQFSAKVSDQQYVIDYRDVQSDNVLLAFDDEQLLLTNGVLYLSPLNSKKVDLRKPFFKK